MAAQRTRADASTKSAGGARAEKGRRSRPQRPPARSPAAPKPRSGRARGGPAGDGLGDARGRRRARATRAQRRKPAASGDPERRPPAPASAAGAARPAPRRRREKERAASGAQGRAAEPGGWRGGRPRPLAGPRSGGRAARAGATEPRRAPFAPGREGAERAKRPGGRPTGGARDEATPGQRRTTSALAGRAVARREGPRRGPGGAPETGHRDARLVRLRSCRQRIAPPRRRPQNAFRALYWGRAPLSRHASPRTPTAVWGGERAVARPVSRIARGRACGA